MTAPAMHSAPDSLVGEIELRRPYIGRFVPRPWRKYQIAEADTLPESSVLTAIAAQRARGAGVLLVGLESDGGDVAAAFVIYDALQAFSRAGGIVVIYARGWNASTATLIALAGDYLVADVSAEFAIHSMIGPDAQEDNRRVLETIAPRVLTPRAELAKWLTYVRHDSPGYIPGQPNVAKLDAALAINHGWADLIGTREEAQAFASSLAAGSFPNGFPTPRRQALAERSARHAGE